MPVSLLLTLKRVIMSDAASPETVKVAHIAFRDFSQGLASGEWSPFLAHVSEDFTFWFPAGPFKGQKYGKGASPRVLYNGFKGLSSRAVLNGRSRYESGEYRVV